MEEDGGSEIEGLVAVGGALRELPASITVSTLIPTGASALENFLQDTRRDINLLELTFARAASRLSALRDADPNEEQSAVQWMRETCRMTSHAAITAVDIGDGEEQLTQSIAALETGEIGIGHLSWMAQTNRRLTESKTAEGEFDETRLLKKAKDLSVQRFRRACMNALHAADRAAYLWMETHAADARRLRLTTYSDGSLHLDACLDPEGGSIFRAALDPLARTAGIADHRDIHQRRADALIDCCQRLLDSGEMARQGGERPHIHVTTTLETLLDFTGAPAATTIVGAQLSAPAVGRLACDSTIIRVLVDAKSMVIDMGRAARVVPASTRRALVARDKGCAWPGCDRDASWTQAHHLLHWAVGGPTNMNNLVLVCRRHHWMVHEGGWVMARDSLGDLQIFSPARFQDWPARDPTTWVA